jgi:hypothetical protein
MPEVGNFRKVAVRVVKHCLVFRRGDAHEEGWPQAELALEARAVLKL